MANKNQPEQMPQAGQGQQGQHQQGQKKDQRMPPPAGQGQQGMGERKNNEEVGEPVQLQEDTEESQQQGASKHQQPQPGGNR